MTIRKLCPFRSVLKALMVFASLVFGSGCDSPSTSSLSKATIESSQHNLLPGGNFGILTTEKYESGWCSAHCINHWFWWELCYAWGMANAFSGVFDNNNTKLFSGGLDWDTGARLQEGYDTISPRGADLVDVLYLHTHGAVYDANNSGWAMWNNGSWLLSQSMRLGDDGRGTKMFVSYTCNTMDTDDGNLWNRLGPLFRGGLKVMVGGYHELSWGTNMSDTTYNFAAMMLWPTTIEYAWMEANMGAAMEQNPAIMATGVDEHDCLNRLYGTNIDHVIHNLDNVMPVIQDDQIGAYCWLWYEGVGG